MTEVVVDLTRYQPHRSQAAKFFNSRDIRRDLGLETAELLFDWLKNDAVLTKSGSVSPALSGTVVYRGQANRDFGVSTSLYRACQALVGRQVTEADLISAERGIVDSMRRQGLGHLMTDLELLQVLQHHGIPTRLLDVSVKPIEALFFAVDSHDASDGRLFLIRLDHKRRGDQYMKRSTTDLPWADAARGQRAADEWTQTVALIDADPLDPRMRAQRGKFLVGGVNRRSAGRSMAGVSKEAYASVSALGVNFLRQLRPRNNDCWPATGWNLTIPADWKPHLRRRLAEDYDIRPDTMYPPVTEVRRLALETVRTSLEAPTPR